MNTRPWHTPANWLVLILVGWIEVTSSYSSFQKSSFFHKLLKPYAQGAPCPQTRPIPARISRCVYEESTQSRRQIIDIRGDGVVSLGKKDVISQKTRQQLSPQNINRSRTTAIIRSLVAMSAIVVLRVSPASASIASRDMSLTYIIKRQIQTSTEVVFRIVYAAILGSFLGRERSSKTEKGSSGAGMRTMALVSLGACVFCLCGTHGFAVSARDPMLDMASTSVDVSRMASSIATGVGFIGAGVITNNRMPDGTYDKESSVRGLTTAATIWVSAAVGVAAGAGMYFAGLQFVLLCLVVLRTGEWTEQPEETVQRKKSVRNPTESASESPSKEAVEDELNVIASFEFDGKTNVTSNDDLWPAIKSPSTSLSNDDQKLELEFTEIDPSLSSMPDSNKDATDNNEAGKPVDPLLEKFLQRGGTLSSKNSPADSDEVFETPNDGISRSNQAKTPADITSSKKGESPDDIKSPSTSLSNDDQKLELEFTEIDPSLSSAGRMPDSNKDATDNDEAGKPVDHLLEKFLQREVTLSSKNSPTDSDEVFETPNDGISRSNQAETPADITNSKKGESPDDITDSQQIIS